MTALKSPTWGACSDERLLELLLGNQDAYNLVKSFVFLSHTYDDLVDGDQKVPEAHLHAFVWEMLQSLPLNPFYKAHQQAFALVQALAIINWRAANEMEKSNSEEELRIAHVLRYNLADAIILALMLVGGREHACKHAREVRLAAQQETWAHYKEGRENGNV